MTWEGYCLAELCRVDRSLRMRARGSCGGHHALRACGPAHRIGVGRFIDDLAVRPRIPTQAPRALKFPAHLVDRLAAAHAQPTRELVIVQRPTGTSKLLKDACSNGQFGHDRIVSLGIAHREAASGRKP